MSTRSKQLREKRRQKQTTARKRAETHERGFVSTTLQLPSELSFWKPREGSVKMDIVPYKAGKGNPFASPGDLHYERTYYIYRDIGAEEKSYVAPGKTFAKPDPIQEYRSKEAKNPNADPEYLKALTPKERQLFLVFDHKDSDKGVQLWEFSYHLFGKLLDSRVTTEGEDWDQFFYPDEGGYTLRVTFEEQKPYGMKATAIDFIERDEPLPEEIVNHGICLDDLLVEMSYEKLKAIFLMQPTDDDKEEEKEEDSVRSDSDEPKSNRRTTKKKEEKKPVAADYGLERGDEVEFEGRTLSIMKVSSDGTSLTLLDEEQDEVIRAVSPADVKPKSSSEKEEKPAKGPDDEGNDDDWDDDDDWD